MVEVAIVVSLAAKPVFIVVLAAVITAVAMVIVNCVLFDKI